MDIHFIGGVMGKWLHRCSSKNCAAHMGLGILRRWRAQAAVRLALPQFPVTP